MIIRHFAKWPDRRLSLRVLLVNRAKPNHLTHRIGVSELQLDRAHQTPAKLFTKVGRLGKLEKKRESNPALPLFVWLLPFRFFALSYFARISI